MVRGLSGFLIVLLLAACGKVGDPLPPFIRIPEPVRDLAVQQNGNDFVLTWTNPARNVDGSAATDLSQVQIISNRSVIAAINVNGASRAQSHSMAIGPSRDERSFAVQIETARGKTSGISNTV